MFRRVIVLSLALSTSAASASEWIEKMKRAYRSGKASVAAAFEDKRVIPMVAIYPCATDFSCVHVGDEEIVMKPASGAMGPAKILAKADYGLTVKYLLEIPLKSGPALALCVTTEDDMAGMIVTPKIVAFDPNLMFNARHPTPAQLAAVVKNTEFLEYLLAPVAAEARLKSSLAKTPGLPMVLSADLTALGEADLLDSAVYGKILRLQSAVNGDTMLKLISDEVRGIESRIVFSDPLPF